VRQWQSETYHLGNPGPTSDTRQRGDDGYLSLDEMNSAATGGSQFGIGIGNADDIFTDVRVGATFNVTGDASRNYHGLAARTNYFVDDGSISGHAGIVASWYVMVIYYEDGPAAGWLNNASSVLP